MILMVLEGLSFLTDVNNASDRFSTSGMIFVAMFELCGPMAKALPKFIVVRRGWTGGTCSNSSSSSSGTGTTSWC